MNDEALKLHNQLCFPLYACARLISQAYRPYLEPLGLTYLQYLVLLVLWESDGQHVNEIGDRLLLDSGTLTPVLKRLEKMGLIERARGRNDDRAVENRLTVAGRRLQLRVRELPLTLLRKAGLSVSSALNIRDTLHDLIPRLQLAADPEMYQARLPLESVAPTHKSA